MVAVVAGIRRRVEVDAALFRRPVERQVDVLRAGEADRWRRISDTVLLRLLVILRRFNVIAFLTFLLPETFAATIKWMSM